jgi:ribosomal protein S18 acetylase RimI-like enzyme
LTEDTSRILASALGDDPFYRSITVDSGEDAAARRACLDRYFRFSIEEGYGIGRVAIAAGEGAAIWVTSADDALLEDARARKQALLSDLLGVDGFSNYRRIVDGMEANLPRDLDPSGWYLSILGVSARRRGAGIGGRLLAPVLADADAAAVPCFLETYNPLSVPFYRRLGFEISGTHVELVTGAAYWVMIRAAAE